MADWLCFSGIPVESKVNIFINSFGSIQETTMVTYTLFSQSLRWWQQSYICIYIYMEIMMDIYFAGHTIQMLY